MATLSGRHPKDTYKDLLQVSNSNTGVDATLRTVEDGEGTSSALQLSTTSAKVNGNFEVTGNISGSVSDGLATAAGTTTARTLAAHFGDITNVKQFGVVGDGVTDDATNINAAITALNTAGGGTLYFPPGTYTVGSSIVLKNKVRLVGAGHRITTIKLITGSNTDVFTTSGYGSTDTTYFGVTDLTIDGNYLASAWSTSTNTYNNSTGYGMKLQGYGFRLDVELINIPEVGLYCNTLSASIPTTAEVYSEISVYGRVFGKEGMVLKGPDDIILHRAFLGLCGILKRPEADTTAATSTVYSGEVVCGVILDGANIEASKIHVYACWSGIGFRTKNTVRFECDHLISESNRGGVDLSSGTYGGGISKLSLRNMSLLHPNWSGSTPAYVQPDANFDGLTMACSGYRIANALCYRTITSIKRVPGTTAFVLSGSNNYVGVAYRNSTAPASDAEVGTTYSGDCVYLSGNYNEVSAVVSAVRGYGVYCTGNGNIINANVQGQTQRSSVGSAIYVSGNGNAVTGVAYSAASPFGGTGSSSTNRIDSRAISSTTRSFTIATGAITVTPLDYDIVIDTEAAAATDDLDTITGGFTGQRVLIKAANSSRDVVLKDGTGNMRLSADMTLDHAQDTIVLFFDGSSWCELSRSNNS
jgi:hypothetical protein